VIACLLFLLYAAVFKYGDLTERQVLFCHVTRREMILTVSSISKENLELATKSRILEGESAAIRDQLRVAHEK
jgi:hypothetical protein